ncbi:MAG: hypothetical protein WD357_05895 [Gracilimonas sp.]
MEQNESQIERPHDPNDKLSGGQIALTICLSPFAGTIMYFMYKNDYPNKSKQACHITLWVSGIAFFLNILFTLAGA